MRNNNFDFLRFVFALFVVISHSYPLSGNSVENQWIYSVTNGQIELSNLGLNGFFIISGYLIFHSLKRSDSLLRYYWKRVLRIFPALIVVLIVTLVLAPIVYSADVSYFSNKEVYSYFFNNVTLYYLQYGINGVFEENIYPKAINGSLWTISYEFTLYILLSLLFLVRKSEKVIKLFIIIGVLGMLGFRFFLLERYGNRVYFDIHLSHFFNLGTYFVVGSFFAIFDIEKIERKNILLFVSLVILIFSIVIGVYQYFMYVFLTLAILLLCLINIPVINDFGKNGDPSYGIYIYGFPVQQTLMHFFNLNTWQLAIYSMLISCICGYLSWHFVEKKFIKLKKLKLNLKFFNYTNS